MQALAIKYRPKTFDDVVEQDAVKVILKEQLSTSTFKQAYLFTGPSGDGKTTMARIFANELNGGVGAPIELDAASQNGVDDVRNIIQQAKLQSIGGEYKVYIIDECHSFSNNAWQAMLKLIEEPPIGTVFIFCTTNPEKIPKTILSRVQRYDFQRISQDGIVLRLLHILTYEGLDTRYKPDAVNYIAKLADGGMRSAITMLDKCLSYSNELTVDNVVKALGIADYDVMFSLLDSILISKQETMMLDHIESIHDAGTDLKQFIKLFTEFVLDMCKWILSDSFDTIKIPNTYVETMQSYVDKEFTVRKLLKILVKLNSDIKWESSPKSMIEAMLLLFMGEEDDRSE